MRQRATSQSSTSSGGGTLSLTARVAALFAHGEQGAWYDPSNMSSMYQDSAGTTPVTAVGQPVAMLLDCRYGLARSAELMTNFNFDLGSTGWHLYGMDDTHIITISGGTLRYQSGTQSPVDYFTNGGADIVRGNTYEVTIDTAASNGVGLLSDQINVGSPIAASAGVQTYRVMAYGGGPVDFYRAGENVDVTINSISIKQIAGNHATQAMATRRPLLRQDMAGHYYLSFDGVDDVIATMGIDFTMTASMTVFAGVMKNTAGTQVAIELSANVDSNDSAFNLASDAAGANDWYVSSGSGGQGQIYGTASPFAAPVANVLTLQFDRSVTGDAQLSLRADGAAQPLAVAGTGSTGNFGKYPLYIGARGGTDLYFNGRLYPLIVRGAASSAAQIALVETYVNSKTGSY